MNNQERVDLSKKIRQVIQSLQRDSDPWVNFAIDSYRRAI